MSAGGLVPFEVYAAGVLAVLASAYLIDGRERGPAAPAGLAIPSWRPVTPPDVPAYAGRTVFRAVSWRGPPGCFR